MLPIFLQKKQGISNVLSYVQAKTPSRKLNRSYVYPRTSSIFIAGIYGQLWAHCIPYLTLPYIMVSQNLWSSNQSHVCLVSSDITQISKLANEYPRMIIVSVTRNATFNSKLNTVAPRRKNRAATIYIT